MSEVDFSVLREGYRRVASVKEAVVFPALTLKGNAVTTAPAESRLPPFGSVMATHV